MHKSIQLGKWEITGLFFAYSIFSVLLFYLTAGGFTSLILVLYLTPVYGVMLLILVILSLFVLPIRRVPLKLVFSVLLIQLLALFFSGGDCGDAPYSQTFFQRITHQSICTSGSPGIPNWWGELFSFLILLYFLVLISSVLYVFARGGQESSSDTQS